MSEPVLLTAYKQLGSRLRSLALRLLGDDSEAEDVLQEAFCRLWTDGDGKPRNFVGNSSARVGDSSERLPEALERETEEKMEAVEYHRNYRCLKAESSEASLRSAEALLTTTVRNLSIDVIRSRTRHPSVSLDEERDAAPDDEAETARERERCFRQLEAAIEERLTPLQREVLHRREYEGCSFETIASDLDMQPTAVRMQLSRARKTIREYLKNAKP